MRLISKGVILYNLDIRPILLILLGKRQELLNKDLLLIPVPINTASPIFHYKYPYYLVILLYFPHSAKFPPVSFRPFLNLLPLLLLPLPLIPPLVFLIFNI
jgi:hypothetical protein